MSKLNNKVRAELEDAIILAHNVFCKAVRRANNVVGLELAISLDGEENEDVTLAKCYVSARRFIELYDKAYAEDKEN